MCDLPHRQANRCSIGWAKMEGNTTEQLVQDMDAMHARTCSAQRQLLQLIVHADRAEIWRDRGARDLAHWISMRYGVSGWKANRWIGAAHALEKLPRIAQALFSGELGIDKVVELARFATPQTEARLIFWARGVSAACIRRRADLDARRSEEEALAAERARFVS
jgi:hypothetical protein